MPFNFPHSHDYRRPQQAVAPRSEGRGGSCVLARALLPRQSIQELLLRVLLYTSTNRAKTKNTARSSCIIRRRFETVSQEAKKNNRDHIFRRAHHPATTHHRLPTEVKSREAGGDSAVQLHCSGSRVNHIAVTPSFGESYPLFGSDWGCIKAARQEKRW